MANMNNHALNLLEAEGQTKLHTKIQQVKAKFITTTKEIK